MPMIKETLREFAGNTSAHGVNKFVTAKGWFIKLIWLLLFLFASSMIVFQTSRLVRNYIRRPVTPTTNVVSKPLPFPSVTICNLNPVQLSLVKDDLLFYIVEEFAAEINMSLKAFPIGNDRPEAVFTQPENTTVEKLLEEYSANFLMQLNAEGKSKIKSLAQSLENFLVACSFAGNSCEHSDFETVLNFDYGVCYRFPNATRYPKGIKFYNAGPVFGLNLVLDIDQKEYVPFLTSGAGVRVRIHEFNTEPYMLEQGQSFPAGFETSISIRPVVTTKLPAPFGDCDPDSDYGDILGCQRECLENVIISFCECSRTATFADYSFDSQRPCDKQDINCIKRILKQKQEGTIVCILCKQPCRKHTYDTKISMTRYPSSHYDPALRYILNQWKDEAAQIYSEDQTRKNIVSLKVYFSDLEEETNTEEEAYPFESLLSDIGGQLGLWLGISILSVCECFELELQATKLCLHCQWTEMYRHVYTCRLRQSAIVCRAKRRQSRR